MDGLEVKQIQEDEINIFVDFLKEIAIWLNINGMEMWNIAKLEQDEFLKGNKNAEYYLGFLNSIPVASVLIKEKDPFMWPSIEADETIFVGKLGVARSYAGTGLSNAMLDFAYNLAIKRSKKFLRLDCYADREYLCNFYEKYGFKLITKREMAPGLFAALYELEI